MAKPKDRNFFDSEEMLQLPDEAAELGTDASPLSAADINAFIQWRAMKEREDEVAGIREVSTWVERFGEYLRDTYYGVQEKIMNPAARAQGETAEHLAGVSCGLMIAIAKLDKDGADAREAEKMKFGGGFPLKKEK